MSGKTVYATLLVGIRSQCRSKNEIKKYKQLKNAFNVSHKINTYRYYSDKEESEEKKNRLEFKKESNERIKKLEELIEDVKSMKPYTDLTLEEFMELRPDIPTLINADGRPSYWPHTEDEQSLETPEILIPDDDAIVAEQQAKGTAKGVFPAMSDSSDKESLINENNIVASSETKLGQMPASVQNGTVPTNPDQMKTTAELPTARETATPQIPVNVQDGEFPSQPDPMKTTTELPTETENLTTKSETTPSQAPVNVQNSVVPSQSDPMKITTELPREAENVITAGETKSQIKPENKEEVVISSPTTPSKPITAYMHGVECDCPKCTAKRKLNLLKSPDNDDDNNKQK
ncbi:uncharacterized protein LOC119667204 [Teleopsis dalmanni]|uniref:uncharacterized protein LOC119667204 n=1 Tax=Teleopsis dalmanni TaxID=139649 RepID=UPI0018CC7E6A|nr:uncharacterized protein LOC119667204 [Teleopsis dalmanni]